ncbi:MAG: ABC transporter substrate-binding protein [Candidatus Binatia bacterium]
MKKVKYSTTTGNSALIPQHSVLYFVLCAVLCAILFALCASAGAQQSAKTPRIGVLISARPSIASPRIQAFESGLRELGYVDGKTIFVEYRYAEGKLEPVPALAADLVRLKVDIIVTDTSDATQAAKNATKIIPIVFTTANDPVGDGQVASLARPGGNLTGLSILALDLNGKRLELLKESFPNFSRIGFLTRMGPSTGEQRFREAEKAAKGLGLELHFVAAKGADDLENAFNVAKRAGVQALLAHPSTFVATNRTRIVELSIKNRLPVIYGSRDHAEAGALMSYGPDLVDNYRRAATYVDKILKGAKPADLPVEQPTKFELVINLKTAKQIEVTIPPNVLARADRVIG